MKVSELADVAGVSVRTIRHYHAIGLLPVPPRAGAWRNYGVDHASRLLRIRALADPSWTEEQARDLVDHGFTIVERYGELPPSLLPSLRFFATNRPARALVIAAYPARGQRRFVEIAFERLADYIEEYSRD